MMPIRYVKCPNCAKATDKALARCQHCGEERSGRTLNWLVVCGGLLLAPQWVVFFGVLLGRYFKSYDDFCEAEGAFRIGQGVLALLAVTGIVYSLVIVIVYSFGPRYSTVRVGEATTARRRAGWIGIVLFVCSLVGVVVNVFCYAIITSGL